MVGHFFTSNYKGSFLIQYYSILLVNSALVFTLMRTVLRELSFLSFLLYRHLFDFGKIVFIPFSWWLDFSHTWRGALGSHDVGMTKNICVCVYIWLKDHLLLALRKNEIPLKHVSVQGPWWGPPYSLVTVQSGSTKPRMSGLMSTFNSYACE